LKVYLDENLSPAIAELLRGRGVDAVSAHEMGNTERPDSAQLRHATGQGRAIVTCDVSDFVSLAADMIAATADHAGIVLISSNWRANDFRAIAEAIEVLARRYPDGIRGAVVFLSSPGS